MINHVWCVCKRSILTTEQMETNSLCSICQKEHASTLKERVEKEQKEDV